MMNFVEWSVFIVLVIAKKVNSQVEDNPIKYCPEDKNYTKNCNIRDSIINFAYWNHWAGYYCYKYTNKDRFKVKNKLLVTYCEEPYSDPIYLLETQPKYASFDYKDEVSLNRIKSLFKTAEYFDIYLDCVKSAEACCENEMNNINIEPTTEYCPVIWDAWDCFPRTKVNTTVKKSCSQQAFSSFEAHCDLNSEKTCGWDEENQQAKWVDKTNYDTCVLATYYKKRHEFNVYTLCITNAISFPAIAIFLGVSKLRSMTKMNLHCNLLIAIVIRNVLTIMSKELILIDQLVPDTKNVMVENSVGCRVLTFLENVFKNGIFACMLVDGFYIHKEIVRNFAREPNKYVLFAMSVVLSVTPSLVWATVKAVNNRDFCWLTDSNNEQWIVDGFRVGVMTINAIILLDILRTIFTKMKQGGASRQAKAALRATFILIFLFGLHFAITAKKVVFDDSCLAEDVYEYFRYGMEALQGIMVAILFCYANVEVHRELKKTYLRFQLYMEERFGWKFKIRGEVRRPTSATYVGS
ncbi:unnamed protein product [Brassicogethes aeneus]|uniref:Uncharacterized protein n=1 Tax=Brassicogethes aeneus TaxID=1431903 RepID=A0A9P0ATS5_BRAAE|nr:unnamed protein product [Brassicogethes aeneus]